MSETADDMQFLGRQLLKKSRSTSFRANMERFSDKYATADPKTVRKTIAHGRDLSEIVREDRDERF